MASENLRDYLESARQRRVREHDVRKQEMATRHEARRLDFEARSEPLNVHLVKVLEEAKGPCRRRREARVQVPQL